MPEKKSSKPSYLQRCVADLIAQGHDKESAFAICTSTMQKAGYLTKGPDMKQTKKGANRARHFSMMKDMPEKAAAYEKGIGRKTESVLGGLANKLSGFADAGLTEASIAKMNRRAKAASKTAPSTKEKPYKSLSREEKSVVDRQIAADAKAWKGQGKATVDYEYDNPEGPVLLIVVDELEGYTNVRGEHYLPNGETADFDPDEWILGSLQLAFQPYLVGANKVVYHINEYVTVADESDFEDQKFRDAIVNGAQAAYDKGGFKAVADLIDKNGPSEAWISKRFPSYYINYKLGRRYDDSKQYNFSTGEPRTYHR